MNLVGWDGQRPLHLAACSSQIEAEMRKETMNKVNLKLVFFPTLFIFAIQDSILMILLNHEKIRINIQDDKGRTPLHHAIARNHSAIAKILCQHEAMTKVNYACFLLKQIFEFSNRFVIFRVLLLFIMHIVLEKLRIFFQYFLYVRHTLISKR